MASKAVILGALFTFLFSSIFSRAQTALSSAGQNIQIQRLTTQDGLSNNSVRCILQDRRGFLWIGTDDGLNRYDGIEFRIFRSNLANSKGLRDDKIKCLYEDGSGHLWIGTVAGGLHRYVAASESFENWSAGREASHSLSSNGVTALCEDDNGTLWIGTSGGGLNSLRPETGEIGRYKYDPQNPNSLSNDNVETLFPDGEGNLWIGTDAGLDLFDPKKQLFHHQHFRQPDRNQSGSAVGVIHGDNTGLLWLGTAFGLVRFNPFTGESQIWQPASSSQQRFEINRITAIATGRNDHLWIGTLSDGLHLFNSRERTSAPFLQSERGIHTGESTITGICRDKTGIIWAGTHNGVYKLLQNRLIFHSLNEEFGANRLTSNYIWPIYEDRDGVIWIGTIAGLNSYDRASGKITHYIHDPKNPSSLNDNTVLAIYEDSRGDLWIGTFTGGLNRFDRKTATFEHWQHDPNDPESLPHNLVDCIYQDRSGTVWIGTGRGLAKFDRDTNQVVRYRTPGGEDILHDQYIGNLLEDRKGNFWIVTLQGGLILLDRQEGAFTQWLHNPEIPNSLSANDLSGILELPDAENPDKYYLWLGTEGGGLNKFDPETGEFRAFTVADGLADNTIATMVMDEAGNIWMGTPKGLSRFNPQTEACRTYDERDGIPDPEFNPWAGMKSRTGELVFGTKSGIIYFDPKDFNDEEISRPPPVVLTGLEVFNRPVTIGKNSPLKKSITESETLRLSHREYIFALKFAALDYAKPEQNRFAYKLEGFHNDWIDIGTRRRVSFTGLSAGEYIFRVKAANSKGLWNDEGAKLKIIVTPPFWQTWWAYTLYVLIFMGGLIVLRRHELHKRKVREEERLRQEREAANLRETQLRAEAAESQTRALQAEQEAEKQQMRMRIAADLHDEIGSNLSSIALLSHLMQDRPELAAEIREAFRDVNRAAKTSTEAIRDIVWLINPQSDQLGNLIARLNQTAGAMLHGIELNFTHPEGETTQKLQPEVKRNIYLIYKEILTNIIKHAQATRVEILVDERDHCLTIRIADNGIGFDNTQAQPGNGLQNMHSRAAQIGGEIRVDSMPGKGTQIQLSLKIT